MLKLNNILKEIEAKTNGLSGDNPNDYETKAEKDFNKYHSRDMYTNSLSSVDKDTIDFDDNNTDTEYSKYDSKKDNIKRGYEPVDLSKMKENKMIKLTNILKEIDTLRKSLMGIGKYDSEAETEFNAHHGGSMYGDHMGNIADKDTTDFDDEEKDRNPGKVVPYDAKRDNIQRGYEPVNLSKLKEMRLVNLIPSNFTTAVVLSKEQFNEEQGPCWKGYQQIGMKTKDGKEVPNCVPVSENDQPGGYYGDDATDEDINSDADVNYGTVEPEEYDVEDEDMADFIAFMRGYDKSLNEGCQCLREAEYQGREVQLGKPMQGDVKKFKVYVKNPKGNVVKVNFGQKGMSIKKNNPERRKSFRARMNCDNPGPRTGARYWSCRKW